MDKLCGQRVKMDTVELIVIIIISFVVVSGLIRLAYLIKDLIKENSAKYKKNYSLDTFIEGINKYTNKR